MAAFYDTAITTINTGLTALGWISNVYKVSLIGVDENGTFPEVYADDGTRVNYRVMPKDNSISFFTIGNISQEGESDYFSCEFSLIVWADLTKVNTSKLYNYTTELVQQVRGVIESNSGYNQTIDFNNAFAGFSQLEKVENQNTMLPYSAFKINFTLDIPICKT